MVSNPFKMMFARGVWDERIEFFQMLESDLFPHSKHHLTHMMLTNHAGDYYCCYIEILLWGNVLLLKLLFIFLHYIFIFFFVIERGVYKPEKRNYNKIKRGVVNPGCLVFMPTKNR